MNEFVKKLRMDKSKENDKVIIDMITNLLNKIEQGAQVKEYMAQVADRKNGIKDIFENFDYNMGIIETKQNKSMDVNKDIRDYEVPLDRYLGKKIKAQSEEMYKEISKGIPQDDFNALRDTRKQVDDRVQRIGTLLEDYRKNKRILDEHRKVGKKYKIESVKYIDNAITH